MRVLQLCFVIYCAAAELNDQLHYFETLHHVDVKVRKKRNVDGHDTAAKDISFSAFGKDFNLVLMPGSPVLSADFKGTLIYRDGQTVPLYINENDFFTGHLSDDKNTKVDAYTEEGLWTASIYTKDNVYTLEPSWRHLPQSDNHSMIVYRHSDIKWDNTFPDLDKSPNKGKPLCGAIHPEDEPDYNPEWELKQDQMAQEEEKNSSRSKRDTYAQNTCHIMAVADATFFHGPGGGFPHRTANYVVQTMQRVNRIYRDTVWGSESLTGMGLQIKELRIHPEITSSSKYHKNGKHYNMFDDHASWPDHELLKQFGEDEDVGKFCLAHLFTHRRFAGGVLGLAYIASPRKVAVGGICSHPDMEKAYNTGFSSTKNTKGNNLLTQEAMLVTAHEFGHNWGAEHDAETRECAPDAYSGGGGKFIMYPYAVSGYDENNNKFSPCSQRYISAVLTTRSDSCFQALTANVPLCGNGIIDKNEDCDGGGMGLSGLDQCCSRDCKLVGNAVCSSTNFECCKDCQMAPQNILCRGSSKELCQEAAFCTGFSLDCPQSKPLKNNTPCIDEGKCVNGVCLDYCAYEGQLIKKVLKPCRCEDVASSCLRCCRSSHETCRPQNKSSSDSFLQDGRPCNYGYCEAGKCHKTSANMIQRLFDFIERLDSSTFVAFMKSNIVGTIIIFSLVVWIPLSWTISCIDKRREKKSREKNLLFVSNDALLLQSLQSNILANRLKDYNVKDSKLSRSEQFHYQTSANLEKPQYQNYFAADESDPKAVNKYTFYKSSAPMEMETVI